MRMLFALIAAIWQLSSYAAASTATITFVSGAVSINRGEGFHKTVAGTEGNPGDTVMVGPASSAEITYAGQCLVKVGPHSVFIIGADNPCSRGCAVGSLKDTPEVKCETVARDPDHALIVGSLVVGGGIGVIVHVNQPASP